MTVKEVEATKAKAAFAELHAGVGSADIAITKHGNVQAYMVSPQRYRLLNALGASRQRDALSRLDSDFDALVARMQDETHRSAVDAIATLPLDHILEGGAS